MSSQNLWADSPETRMAATDRIIVLEVMPGHDAKAASGIVDKRLFTGENRLHAIKDEQTLWYMKYDSGGLPEPLKQKFTSFKALLKWVETYMSRRNIRVKEVIW